MIDSNKQSYQVIKKSVITSIGVNSIISVIQVVTGILSHSQALIADGVHSFSDLIADFIILIANKKSQKPPDDDHPYGHLRYRNAAHLFLGLLLFIIGVSMLWLAITTIRNLSTIPSVHINALIIALFTLIIKELLFKYMIAVAKKINSAMLVANAWHIRSDAISSLIVALGILGNLLGIKLLDPIAACIIGVFIIKIGFQSIYQSLHDLMDKSADATLIKEVKEILLTTAGISGIHDLRSRKVGDFILVDVHLEISGKLTVKEGHEIATKARQRVLKKKNILNVMTHVDPC